MKPGRVLMTADAVGGVWTYSLDLSEGLAGAGVEVALAVLGPAPDDDQRRAARAVPGMRLIETGLPLDWSCARPDEIAAAAAAITRLAAELGADLVHLNSPALAADVRYESPVVGVCHSCLATWWAAVKSGPMPADFSWRTQVYWRGLLACDGLAAPSESFAAEIARTYDIPRPFVASNARRPLAERPRRPRERLVFTAGRLWDEGKNVAVLDAAAGRLDAPFVAAGPLASPDGRARIEPQHLQTTGAISAGEVGDWTQRASVFASAALYEPFGLGVLEAAQAGCALVLSDIPTFRELWDGAARFADARDPAAFANEIQRLVADPAEARRLGARARDAAGRFDVATMTRSTLELYSFVLGAPAGRMEARA